MSGEWALPPPLMWPEGRNLQAPQRIFVCKPLSPITCTKKNVWVNFACQYSITQMVKRVVFVFMLPNCSKTPQMRLVLSLLHSIVDVDQTPKMFLYSMFKQNLLPNLEKNAFALTSYVDIDKNVLAGSLGPWNVVLKPYYAVVLNQCPWVIKFFLLGFVFLIILTMLWSFWLLHIPSAFK